VLLDRCLRGDAGRRHVWTIDGSWKTAEQKDILILVKDFGERAWGCVLNEEESEGLRGRSGRQTRDGHRLISERRAELRDMVTLHRVLEKETGVVH
jgi:hypothetical protein